VRQPAAIRVERNVRDAVEKSLRRLGVERIDLFQLHGWLVGFPFDASLGMAPSSFPRSRPFKQDLGLAVEGLAVEGQSARRLPVAVAGV
jgi:hypothetical protein